MQFSTEARQRVEARPSGASIHRPITQVGPGVLDNDRYVVESLPEHAG
jgi:hypothetical protein